MRPRGLKPVLILEALRGAEAPLFHGNPRICEFFRNMLKAAIDFARLRGRLKPRPFKASSN
jgi:hypothetical protein